MTRTCHKVRKLIHDELDGDLSPERRALVGNHLDACSLCRDYRAQMLHLSAGLSSLALHDMPLQPGRLARQAEVSSTALGFWEALRGLALSWAARLRVQRRLWGVLRAVLLTSALGWAAFVTFSAAGFAFLGLAGARVAWILGRSLVEAFRASASALALTGSSLLPTFAALGALEAALLIVWLALRRRRAVVSLLA